MVDFTLCFCRNNLGKIKEIFCEDRPQSSERKTKNIPYMEIKLLFVLSILYCHIGNKDIRHTVTL